MRIPRPRLPARTIAAAVAALALLAAGWLWFRDSSFAQVEDVFITGVTSSERAQVRRALRTAALDMSTLHVREDALRTAVAPYASVAGLRVEPEFPHKLVIEVVEHDPVAALEAGGRRLPVSGSGLVLRGVRAPEELATVRVGRLPAGERIVERRPLLAVRTLAAGPPPLRRRVERAWFGPRGLTLDLDRGPRLIFGDDRAARAKWAAAARVLADPGAAGATYLDVRVPGRVGAGGLAPVVRETPTPGTTASAALVEPVVTPTPAPLSPAVTPPPIPPVNPQP